MRVCPKLRQPPSLLEASVAFPHQFTHCHVGYWLRFVTVNPVLHFCQPVCRGLGPSPTNPLCSLSQSHILRDFPLRPCGLTACVSRALSHIHVLAFSPLCRCCHCWSLQSCGEKNDSLRSPHFRSGPDILRGGGFVSAHFSHSLALPQTLEITD